MQDERLMDQSYVPDYLESLERSYYSIFHRSNFYQATGEFLSDGTSIGTACMFVEATNEPGVVRFDTRHPREIFIAENAQGVVDTVFRVFRLTARQAVQQFGKDDLPQSIRDMAEDEPHTKYRFLHACFPASDKVPGQREQGKAFVSTYMSLDELAIISEGGYYEMPYIVWRWNKNSDETYGRSPAIDSIYDILRVNKIAKSLLQASQLAVEPPMNVPEEMRGQENLVPRGYNYFRNPQMVMSPAMTGARIPEAMQMLELTRQAIDEAFKVDFFLMLNRSDRTQTAREVIEKQGEKAAILGAILGRLNADFLTPLIMRVYGILERAGWPGVLPEKPWALQSDAEGTESEFKVEFIGPLAQAQKRYAQTQGVNAAFLSVAPVWQVDQATMDIFDMDQLARKLAEANGMPQDIIRERYEITKIRKQKAEAAQAQQAAAQAAADAQIYGETNESPAPGSPAEQLVRQMDRTATVDAGSPTRRAS
jgi:hypothetical protein